MRPRFPHAVLVLVLAAATVASHPHAQGAAPGRVSSGVDAAGFDRSIRPQDDFFAHVNGGWQARTEIPADKTRVGSFSTLADSIKGQLRALAEEGARPGAPAKLQKIGAFYQTFMDESAVERIGLQPLAAELAAIDAISASGQVPGGFVRLAVLGVVIPVLPVVAADADRPDVMALAVRQGGLGLPGRDYYLEEGATYAATREQYARYVTTLLTLATNPAAAQAGSEFLQLEAELARAQWSAVQSRDRVAMHNPMDSDSLGTRFPGFDWRQWQRGLGVESAARHGQRVRSRYMEALAKLTTSVPVARWKRYMKAALLDEYAPYLGKPFVDAEFAFRGATLNGRKANPPRLGARRRCPQRVDGACGRRGLHRTALPARVTGAHGAADREPAGGVRRGHRPVGLDDAADEARGPREAAALFSTKIGYPEKWRDYGVRGPSGRAARHDDARRRRPVRAAQPAGARGTAVRSRPSGR